MSITGGGVYPSPAVAALRDVHICAGPDLVGQAQQPAPNGDYVRASTMGRYHAK